MSPSEVQLSKFLLRWILLSPLVFFGRLEINLERLHRLKFLVALFRTRLLSSLERRVFLRELDQLDHFNPANAHCRL